MVKGVLADLESLIYKYVRYDLNTIIKICSSRKKRKILKLLGTQRSSRKTQALWAMDLWLIVSKDCMFNPINVCI